MGPGGRKLGYWERALEGDTHSLFLPFLSLSHEANNSTPMPSPQDVLSALRLKAENQFTSKETTKILDLYIIFHFLN